MKLSDLFQIEYGQHEYNSKENLSKGKTPLISSQATDRGCFGFFDISAKYKPPILTIPRTGSIGYANVQDFPCCVDDNCLVLIPKQKMSIAILYEVAANIRKEKWRYKYGRQITPKRLGNTEIKLKNIQINVSKLSKFNIPIFLKNLQKTKYGIFKISDIFEVETGQFHKIEDLEEGNIPLISCSTEDMGITGFYKIPFEKTYTEKITVAYDGKPLFASFHLYRFAAYDNVGILIPKQKTPHEVLIFITNTINQLQWKYSYGRKCYREKLKKLKIPLPIKDDLIDCEYILNVFKSFNNWNKIKNQLID